MNLLRQWKPTTLLITFIGNLLFLQRKTFCLMASFHLAAAS